MVNIFRSPFKKNKPGSIDGIYYASFNRRLVAMSLNLIIMILALFPLNLLLSLLRIDSSSVLNLVKEHTEKNIQNQTESLQSITGIIEFLNDRGILTYYIIANYIVPLILTSFCIIFFWIKYNATPGQMLTKCKIVDAKTMRAPTKKQYILRFIGYFISILSLTLGFLMIGLNKRKRGLHDFLAGTAVIVKN